MAANTSAETTVGSPVVDHNALRVNQACIIIFLALGFLLNQPWLVVFVCAVMLIGTAFPKAALFQRLYLNVLRPAGLLKSDLRNESPAPHRFAQGMGGSVLLLAALALFAGTSALGWGLVFLVIALAAVNLLFGFCAGCFVFFQLQRLRG
jgi:hypothetical protein